MLLQTVPLTILNYLLTIKISYFLFSRMWKVRSLPWHERRIYHKLTSFSVFPFFQLLQLLECLSRYMCGDNLTMKVPPDFHNYTGLNGLVNSFPRFTIAPPNELILGCKPHWSTKMKKAISCEKWLLGVVLQNSFPKNLLKITEKYPWESLCNTVKSFHAVRLATVLKKDPLTGVSEQDYKINRKAPEFESLFK